MAVEWQIHGILMATLVRYSPSSGSNQAMWMLSRFSGKLVLIRFVHEDKKRVK